VEKESEKDAWKVLGVVTTARIKRMADTQFISELMLVVLRTLCWDSTRMIWIPSTPSMTMRPKTRKSLSPRRKFTKAITTARSYLAKMEEHDNAVSQFAQSFTHFYTLWCVIALNLATLKAKPADEIAKRLHFLHEKGRNARCEERRSRNLYQEDAKNTYQSALSYYSQARGASTDLTPRQERYDVLKRELFG